MSKRLADSIDLSALFDIAIEGTGPAATDALLCQKCHGRGKFLGYTGRVVGPCFACDGTGLVRTAGVVVPEGGCAKCCGTGEWRPGRPCFACNGTGKVSENTTAAIDVGAIATAFAAANAAGIKRPKLRLDTFIFSRAPDHGRNAGSIYVTEDGTYRGKVAAGEFMPVRECDAPTTARIVTAAADPHNAAKAYGARTGVCSCCGRELTNKESIDLGIGPICRDKFGW